MAVRIQTTGMVSKDKKDFPLLLIHKPSGDVWGFRNEDMGVCLKPGNNKMAYPFLTEKVFMFNDVLKEDDWEEFTGTISITNDI